MGNTGSGSLWQTYVLGTRLTADLEHVCSLLSSAKGFGVWDMLGGGFFATAFKHDKIDKAQAALELLLPLLSQYRQALSQNSSLLLESSFSQDSLLTFADYFLDGLLADFFVQSRLAEHAEKMQALLSEIQRCQAHLQEQIGDQMPKRPQR